MNRSKVFLGVTTGLLAVAGVAAAKRFGPQATRWYCTTGIGSTVRHCAQVNVVCPQVPDGAKCTYTIKVNGINTPYTVFTKGALSGTVPQPCTAPNNCISTLKYEND